jgi:hypothetical protein
MHVRVFMSQTKVEQQSELLEQVPPSGTQLTHVPVSQRLEQQSALLEQDSFVWRQLTHVCELSQSAEQQSPAPLRQN